MVVFSVLAWIMAVALFSVTFAILLRRRALCGAISIAFLGFLMLVRPVLFAFGLDEPFPAYLFGEYHDLIVRAYLLFVIWIVLFLCGYYLPNPLISIAALLFPSAPAVLPRKVPFLFAVALTAIAIAATSFLVTQYGSVVHFMDAVKRLKDLAGLYVIREISVVAAIICLIGFMNELSKQRTRHLNNQPASFGLSSLRSRGLIWIYGALIVLSLTTNFVWGNRTNIGYLLVVTGFSYHVFIRRLKLREIATYVMVSGIGLWFLKSIRIGATASVLGTDSFFEEVPFWTSLSTSLHFTEFDALMLAIRDVGSAFELRQGKDFLNGLVSWVPRQLWPEKPDSHHVGKWFRQVYQPEMINGWPTTSIGSWYVNFGLLGVPVGGFLSGAIARAVDLCYTKTVHTNAFSAVMSAALGLFLLGEGYDAGTPQAYVLLVVPLSLFALIVRFTRKRAEPSPPVLPRFP